ncbi:hypothetical protein Bca4012_071554 [Brassica carinata]
MHAFPLLELGRMEEDAAASRKGYEINKKGAWAHHCVYLNAIGLLLRLDVRDALKGSIGDRLKLLADRLTDQENWYMSWHLVTLIVWGLAKIIEDEQEETTSDAERLGEAVCEYAKGNYKKQALELLGSDFNAFGYKVIGASDEQIDVFNEMWCQLLLKTGQSKNAKEVIRERIKVRDGVPFMWRLLEKSYTMVGDAEAESAGERELRSLNLLISNSASSSSS